MGNREAKLQALRDTYAKKLPAMLADIGSVAIEVRATPADQALMDELYGLVHALVGSAGTFGFHTLGQFAGVIERKLVDYQQGKSELDEDNLQLLLDDISRLNEFTEQESSVTVVNDHVAHKKIRENANIFIIEDDPLLAGELISQLTPYGWELDVFPNRTDAEAVLKHSEPAAVVVDVVLPEGDMAGIDLIHQLNAFGYTDMPKIIMSSRWDWEARLAAVKAGADAYLSKPVDYAYLAEVLDSYMEWHEHEPYRIMIVDDSELLAHSHARVLESANMLTKVVLKPDEVLHALESFRPELILMDVYMPECSGVQVAKVIRQDSKYLSVPIVYLSTEVTKSRQMEALKIGGDEFLTKPIAPGELIAAVTTRVERFRSLANRIQQDSLTGLLNHTTFKMQLELEVNRSLRSGSNCVLAMLDIDHFKNINDSYGHPVGDKVLRTIAKVMKSRLRKGDVIGRYGGEEFAVLMPDTSIASSVTVLDELRQIFSKVLFAVDGGDFNSTFSAGVADVTSFSSVDGLIAAADEKLYAAKAAGRNRVVA